MENVVLKRGLSVITIAAMMATVFALPVLTDSSVQAATKKVKVTYRVNDGKFAAKKYAKKKSYAKRIRKYEKLGKLPKVVRSGYVLRGWYTKKRGDTPYTQYWLDTTNCAWIAIELLRHGKISKKQNSRLKSAQYGKRGIKKLVIPNSMTKSIATIFNSKVKKM